MKNTQTPTRSFLKLAEVNDEPYWEPEVVPAPKVPDDETIAELFASVDDPLLPKVQAPAPPEPATEVLDSQLLLSATSSLSDEALDDQVKELCRRRRRNDEALAALVYEKNLRLAKVGRDGEFAAWYSQPDIDLSKPTAYAMIHRHAARHGLPLPWQLKEGNSTEPYDSSSPFEVNPDYGKPVSDSQADAMKDGKAKAAAARKGREYSTIARVDFVCETVEMKDELLAIARKLGLATVAPHVHALLRRLHDRFNRLKAGLPSWFDLMPSFGGSHNDIVIPTAQTRPPAPISGELVLLETNAAPEIVIPDKENNQ